MEHYISGMRYVCDAENGIIIESIEDDVREIFNTKDGEFLTVNDKQIIVGETHG